MSKTRRQQVNLSFFLLPFEAVDKSASLIPGRLQNGYNANLISSGLHVDLHASNLAADLAKLEIILRKIELCRRFRVQIFNAAHLTVASQLLQLFARVSRLAGH